MRGSSPIWQALAQAVRADCEARGAVLPLAGAVTRRRVLGALAAGAALPLGGCLPPSLRERPVSVAIVGAGLAGLNALRLLDTAGVDARVFEARGRVGGRVFTARSGPVPADDGGQFINSDHADMLDLARAHGLGLIDRGAMAGRTLVTLGGQRVPMELLVRSLAGLAGQVATDAAALASDPATALRRIDTLSAAAYLDRAKVPYQARALIEATIRTEFGQEPGEASAVELIWNLPKIEGGALSLISSSDERFVLHGGSSMLVEALYRPLAARIETGRALVAIGREGDGVRLTFASGESVTADRAIVTLPAPLLRYVDFGGLLPPLWSAYAAEIGCGRNEKLNAAYDGRPWEGPMGRSGDLWPVDGPFAEAWDAGTTTSSTGLMTYFMGGDQCDRADAEDTGALRAGIERAAEQACPGLAEAALPWQRRTAWGRDPFARGAYSCFRPGQLSRFAGLMWIEEEGKAVQAPAVGPLVFAGEHLSDAWPGYMNGGLQTGRLAAQAVLAAMTNQNPLSGGEVP